MTLHPTLFAFCFVVLAPFLICDFVSALFFFFFHPLSLFHLSFFHLDVEMASNLARLARKRADLFAAGGHPEITAPGAEVIKNTDGSDLPDFHKLIEDGTATSAFPLAASDKQPSIQKQLQQLDFQRKQQVPVPPPPPPPAAVRPIPAPSPSPPPAIRPSPLPVPSLLAAAAVSSIPHPPGTTPPAPPGTTAFAPAPPSVPSLPVPASAAAPPSAMEPPPLFPGAVPFGFPSMPLQPPPIQTFPVPLANPPPTAAAGSSVSPSTSIGAKRQRTEKELVPEEQFLLEQQSQGGMNVTLRVQVPNDPESKWNFHGQILEIEMKLTDSILDLKNKISSAALNSMPSNKQKLRSLSDGSVLKDNVTLAYYNIESGTELEVAEKERGGRKGKGT